ncbi:hypothetical protein BDY19DRAFT_994216 [Irpex rosettiformis]|uniref:Uncharacterized protein n=1 Tax=Irpex rosettiformis TaxID=378272 RepID=A0ACB8U1Z1_9APHY|nr:hypothetical protein BDY19DRAFT_994216 [Irpex rosettiformis]
MAGYQNPALEQFKMHDFDADESYQGGLRGMISSGALEGKTENEKNAWLLQTRVFYFNHMNNAGLTIEEAVTATAVGEENNGPSNATPSSDERSSTIPKPDNEPRTLSFAELKELIEQGKTDQIPNNRVIPNELSTELPSESKATVRKKPWEV